MTRTQHAILVPALAAALAAAFAAPAAADGDWQLKLSGVYAESTAGGAPDGSFGGGLAVEYRATPRLGIELGGLIAELEDDTSFEVFGARVNTETELGFTPVLARLDFHLTPDRRADVYLGPVAGYVFMDDLTLRSSIGIPGLPVQVAEEIRFRTDDQLTWGAHVGVDVRLGAGDSRSFLSAGVTYLDLPIEIEVPAGGEAEDDNTIDFEEFRGDLDPLVFHVGYSYRF